VGTGDPNTGYTDYGSLGDYTLSVVLSNAGLDPPTAVASATPVSGRAPLEVQFSGSDSADADGSVASFLWNFGDGVISAEADPRHVYTVGGTFIASLVVTDNDGLRATNSIGIAVLVPPGQPLGLRISTAR
jgi:PKD repeat protein